MDLHKVGRKDVGGSLMSAPNTYRERCPNWDSMNMLTGPQPGSAPEQGARMLASPSPIAPIPHSFLGDLHLQSLELKG